MKEKALFVFGILCVILIFLVVMIRKNVAEDITNITYQAKEAVSIQEYQEAIDIIEQRMINQNIEGKVSYQNDKITLKIEKESFNDETLNELLKKGNLLLVDEAGDILFDNSHDSFIEMARAIYNEEGSYSLAVKFKEEVSDNLSEITQKNIGKKIMVILDDEIYASPVIEQKIDDGELLMSRIDTIEQAKLLEEIWNSQCLPCEFERCK